MWRFIVRLAFGVTWFFIGVVLTVGWNHFANKAVAGSPSPATNAAALGPAESGRIDAQMDLARGRVKYLVWGYLMDPGPNLFKEHLKRDYGIEWERVAGCVTSEYREKYWTGYNEISVAWIEQRYGKGILEKVMDQAVKESDQRYRSWSQR